MKHILVLIVVCLFSACYKSEPAITHSTDITVVHDITDQFQEQPDEHAILKLYDFANDKNQAARFRYVLITDRNLNAVAGSSIDDGSVTEKLNVEDEVNYRERLIYSFYNTVRNTMQTFKKEFSMPTPLPNSECFSTIATEICKLAESKSSQRILVVFSDLAENSSLFNCYSAKDRQLLSSNPKKVAKRLLQGIKLPDNLQGITIYFVFRPPDRESDILFGRMVSIYKQLLHERGARVVVQATSKQFEL